MSSDAAPAEAALPPPAPQGRFVTGNLFRHVAVMSLTSSVGLMAIFVVDLINLVYISWLGDPVLTAAVGYAGAVLFFATAFGIGLAVGVSVQVSQAVGARDLPRARARATEGLVFGAGASAAFAAVVFALLPWIVAQLGAIGRTADETLAYLRPVMPTLPLLVTGMIGAAVLRAHGQARQAMMVTVWGALALAVLDPVLILWARWDLTGAAVSVGVSRAVIAAMALWPLWRHHGGFVPLRAEDLRRAMRPLMAISGPAILTQLATPVGQALVTRMVAGYGEAAVAGMAVAGRLTPVAFGIIFALSGAIGPIIGQNLGARRLDRVRRAFADAVLFCALVIGAMSLVLFLARAPIADAFRAGGLTRDIVYLFCGPLSLLFFFNGVIFVANAACNNLGAAFQSTLVNWGRHTLGTVPFAWALGIPYGPQGVLAGQALGGVLFAAVAWWQVQRALTAVEAHGGLPAGGRPR